MDRLIRFRPAFAAVAFALAAVAVASGAHASTPGYLWLQAFSANSAGSTGRLTLGGTIVNYCNGGLPAGSQLRISFDQGILLKLPITAGFGQAQRFSRTVSVPQVPPPHKNVTAYRFTILLPPGAAPTHAGKPVSPDMKTSPCLVTGVVGIPSE